MLDTIIVKGINLRIEGWRSFMTDKEYEDALKKFHKATKRHILVVETNIPQDKARQIFAHADRLRKAGNELVAIMRNRYTQLRRTKRYRKLLLLYGKEKDELKRKKYAAQLKDMQKRYDVTWNFCRTAMIPIGKKYSVHSVFALTKAEDVWTGVQKCLYRNGKILHFSKYGDYPCLRAKQIDRGGIPISRKDNALRCRIGGMGFGLKIKDDFQQKEINAVMNYLRQPEAEDMYALKDYLDEGKLTDTFRPCYATLVPKKIRGRFRVFLHLCIEGKALPKKKENGKPRHSLGYGIIGADIGTQTVAYTSRTKVGLKNLAERGQSIQKSERQERLLYRAMDRSRRATNPQNYNADGTIKKGPKKWNYSKRYKRLRYRHANLCRKNAINRKLAIHEDANNLRGLGNIFITEPKNAAKLMRRAKETTVNKKGKFNRKKRFGKSIRNRCPGTFQSVVQQKFESTGGLYIEMPITYRASQYDHTADDYIKKKLSQRMFNLTDGTRVQRDWYSSFLLYCCDRHTLNIDKFRCRHEFSECLEKEKAMIAWIKANKIKVLNSGIKIAA